MAYPTPSAEIDPSVMSWATDSDVTDFKDPNWYGGASTWLKGKIFVEPMKAKICRQTNRSCAHLGNEAFLKRTLQNTIFLFPNKGGSNCLWAMHDEKYVD